MVTTASALATAVSALSAIDAAIGLGAGQRVLAEVEGHHLMPRLGEVRGHPAAHVAKPDECDACHVLLVEGCPSDFAGPHSPRALVDEGGHAFLLVLGAEQAVEQAALEVDALRQAASRTRR